MFVIGLVYQGHSHIHFHQKVRREMNEIIFKLNSHLNPEKKIKRVCLALKKSVKNAFCKTFLFSFKGN